MKNREAVSHQMGKGGQYNNKHIDKAGHLEAVYDRNGNLVKDCLNMGTYNYKSPDNALGHIYYDVIHYMILCNAPSDL